MENFLGKGHSQAALSLWNNMFEPVGGKRESWHIGESLKCPTKDYPYIFTSKNSARAFDELTDITTVQTASSASTISSSINNSTLYINTTSNQISTVSINSSSTSDSNTTINPGSTVNSSGRISTSDVTNTSQRYPKKHKHDKKSDSDSSFNKMKFLAITGFLFIIIMVLIVGIMRRQKLRVFIRRNDQPNFDRLNEELYEDEVEIYSRSQQKSNYFDNNEITKTHGTRMPFD